LGEGLRCSSVRIEGGPIVSAALRRAQAYSSRTSNHSLAIILPPPTISRAPEAYISARQKKKLFETAGFRVRMIAGLDGLQSGGGGGVGAGELFVLQRPVAGDWRPFVHPEAVDLNAVASGDPPVSAVAEVVARILAAWPGLDRQAVAVVGARGAVGRDVVRWLDSRGVPRTELDLGDRLALLRGHDVIVSATGVPHLISLAHSDGCGLAIDVGFTYRESSDLVFGDISPELMARTRYHTPVPGGVGPLQSLTLLERALAHIGGVPYSPWSVDLRP
jgi:hypothetical protein